MIKLMMDANSCPDLNDSSSMNFRKAVKSSTNHPYKNCSQTLFNHSKNSEMTKLNCRKERLNCSSIAGRTAAQSSVIEAHMQECTLENCDFCKMIYSQKQDQVNIYFEEGPNSTLIFKKSLSPCSSVKTRVENHRQEDASYEICEMMFTVEEESNDFLSFDDGFNSSSQTENAIRSEGFVEQQPEENGPEPLNSGTNSNEAVQCNDFKEKTSNQSKESQCVEKAFTQSLSEHDKLHDSSSFDSCSKNEAVQSSALKSDVSNYSKKTEHIHDETSEDHLTLSSAELIHSSSNLGEMVRCDVLKNKRSFPFKENVSSDICDVAFSQDKSSKENTKFSDWKSFSSAIKTEENVGGSDFKDKIPNQSKEYLCEKGVMSCIPDEHPKEHLKFHTAESPSNLNAMIHDCNSKESNQSTLNACYEVDEMAHSQAPKPLGAASMHLIPQANETALGNYFKDKISNQSTLNTGCEEEEVCSQKIDSKEHLKHLIAVSNNLPPQSKEIVRGNYSKDKINDHSSLNAGSEMFAMACDQDIDSKEHLKHLIAVSNDLPPQSNETIRGNYFKDKINDQSTLNVGCSVSEVASNQDMDSKEHLKHLIAASFNSPPQSNETVHGKYSKDKINYQATLNIACSVGDMESSQDMDSKEHLKHLIGASINFPPQSNETVHGNYSKDKINDQSVLNKGCEEGEMACDQDTDSKEHLKHLIAASIRLSPQSNETVRGNYFKDKISDLSEGNARLKVVCTQHEGSEERHQCNKAESLCLPSTSNQTVRGNDFTHKMGDQSIRNANCEMSERAYAKGESSYEHLKLPSSGSFHLPSSSEIIVGNNFEDTFVDQSIEAHEMCEVIFKEEENVEKPNSILFAGALPPSVYRERRSANNGLLVNPLPYCEEMPRCGICGKMFFSDNELKAHFGTHYKKDTCSAHDKVIPQNRILVDQTRVRESSLSGGLSSSEESHLKMQEKSQAKQTSYVCFFCHKSFTEFKNLNEHVKYHNKKEPYSCTVCKKVFGLVSQLEIHERTHIIERRYSCYYCESKFARHRELKEHLLVHTGKKAFVCKYCNKEYLFLSHLKIHMNVHVKDRLMSCQFCGKKFTSRSDYREHLKLHKIKPYSCDYCDKKFGEVINLKTHMRIHTGRVIYSCMYCKKDFGFISQLKIHEKTHTREKKYSCHMCKESFTRHNELKEHVLGHTGKKVFSCNYCNKEFLFMSHFSKHLSIHTMSKAFSCDRCGKVFPSPDCLRKHIQLHNEEKLFPCDLCQKVFSSLPQLQSHSSTHTGEKPFPGNYSQNLYSHRSELIEQTQTNAGELSFACEYCEKAFGEKDQLERHLQTHSEHPMFLVNFLQNCSKNIVSLNEA